MIDPRELINQFSLSLAGGRKVTGSAFYGGKVKNASIPFRLF
jgi:hypothetical protein